MVRNETSPDVVSAEFLFLKIGYYKVDKPDFSGYVFEKIDEGENIITSIYIYIDGTISKVFYIVEDEIYEAAGSILYEELVAIYQLHKEMSL